MGATKYATELDCDLFAAARIGFKCATLALQQVRNPPRWRAAIWYRRRCTVKKTSSLLTLSSQCKRRSHAMRPSLAANALPTQPSNVAWPKLRCRSKCPAEKNPRWFLPVAPTTAVDPKACAASTLQPFHNPPTGYAWPPLGSLPTSRTTKAMAATCRCPWAWCCAAPRRTRPVNRDTGGNAVCRNQPVP